MSLLELIHDAVKPIQASPEEKEKTRELKPYFDSIKETLGVKFIDEFYRLNAESWCIEVDEAFARGFRVGGLLMLEVLSPRDPKE